MIAPAFLFQIALSPDIQIVYTTMPVKGGPKLCRFCF